MSFLLKGVLLYVEAKEGFTVMVWFQYLLTAKWSGSTHLKACVC